MYKYVCMQAYMRAKEKLIRAEWHVLDALQYDVSVDNPNRFIRLLLPPLGITEQDPNTAGTRRQLGCAHI